MTANDPAPSSTFSRPSLPWTGWLAGLLWLTLAAPAHAVDPAPGESRNKAERLEWFRDAGLGLFIHWSVDCQLGTVISHSLVGASDDYVKRYYNDLPKTFNPKQYDPKQWADLAKIAGFRYMVVTAKHHNGFCLWPSKTTTFDVEATPYKKDILKSMVDAFREKGIEPGFYFSPDDFHYLYRTKTPIARRQKGVYPQDNPGLMKLDQQQINELLTAYGKIATFFIDGPPQGLREQCWDLQPNIVVTRGAIKTPEQQVPGLPINEPWESNVTLGTQWQYKTSDEKYKPAGTIIDLLIQARAKGGNFLINIGPDPNGRIPRAQSDILRTLGAWMFVNQEAIYAVRPWIVTNENNIWFTKKKNTNTVYAHISNVKWALGERKEFVLKSIKATDDTTVEILGQSGKILEYRPGTDVKGTFKQTSRGLSISVMRAQRLHNDRQWPYPVVVKISNVQPGMKPPVVHTQSWNTNDARTQATIEGLLENLGEAKNVQVSFEYRVKPLITELYADPPAWNSTGWITRSRPGRFKTTITGLDPNKHYEYRAMVKSPLITLRGDTWVVPDKKYLDEQKNK